MNGTQIFWMALALFNAFTLGLQAARMLPKGYKVTGADMFWAVLLVILIGASTVSAVKA
jgi:hypothetical protein